MNALHAEIPTLYNVQNNVFSNNKFIQLKDRAEHEVHKVTSELQRQEL